MRRATNLKLKRSNLLVPLPGKVAKAKIDPEAAVWLEKRMAMVKQSQNYQPKTSRQDRRKKNQVGS